MRVKQFILATTLLISVPLHQAIAAETKAKAEQSGVSVNGVAISSTLLDQSIKAALAQGQKDTPELRLSIKEDLINREILAQDSAKKGLDKSPEAKLALEQARRNILVDVNLNDYFTKHPITDSDLKSEYDKQVASVGSDAKQYKISHIVLATEAEAKDVLAKAKKGEAFAQLAKQYSIDKSGGEDGSIDWILPVQIVPEISNVMVNLSKGNVANNPIQTQTGWHIIKVDDIRPFKAPSFDEAKNNLKMSLVIKKQAEYVTKLRESAKIVE